MNVLVAYASKHAATAEIAGLITERIRRRGLQVEEASVDEVTTLETYDAYVIGSAVYTGHWLKPARRLIDRFRNDLPGKPVWLFSSGPIGEPPKPDGDPIEVGEIVEAIGVRDHRVFAGRLDKSLLGFGERAMITAVKAPEGDFRDWEAIREWADGIAQELAEAADTTAPS